MPSCCTPQTAPCFLVLGCAACAYVAWRPPASAILSRCTHPLPRCLQGLPGGLSHIMAVLAIARSLHARGHSIYALMADYDLHALRERGLLGDWVQPVTFRTPPGSVEELEAVVTEYQNRPKDVRVGGLLRAAA